MYTNQLRVLDLLWDAYTDSTRPFGEEPPTTLFHEDRVEALVLYRLNLINTLDEDPSFRLPGKDICTGDDDDNNVEERRQLVETNTCTILSKTVLLQTEDAVNPNKLHVGSSDTNANLSLTAVDHRQELREKDAELREKDAKIKQLEAEKQEWEQRQQQERQLQEQQQPDQQHNQVDHGVDHGVNHAVVTPAKPVAKSATKTPIVASTAKKVTTAKKASTAKKAVQHNFAAGDKCTVKQSYSDKEYAGKEGVVESVTAQYVTVVFGHNKKKRRQCGSLE